MKVKLLKGSEKARRFETESEEFIVREEKLERLLAQGELKRQVCKHNNIFTSPYHCYRNFLRDLNKKTKNLKI